MKQVLLELLPPRAYLQLKHMQFKRNYPQQFRHMQDLRRTETEQGYSYRPFDETKSIFVHIPKCAGVSVCRAIYGGLAGGHETFNNYLNIFEPRCILNYFKFTIVRNPWDRLVSAYFFLKNGGFNNRDREWFNQELGNVPNFDQFVKQWLNRTNIWKWHHFRPQYHYVLDRRQKVSLDFVDLVENIDADFTYIAGRVGTAGVLPRTNASRHGSYVNYYTQETIDIVTDVYREDIEIFGYNFDNSSVPQQLASRGSGRRYLLKSNCP